MLARFFFVHAELVTAAHCLTRAIVAPGPNCGAPSCLEVHDRDLAAAMDVRLHAGAAGLLADVQLVVDGLFLVLEERSGLRRPSPCFLAMSA